MPASIAINVVSRLLTPQCFSSDGFRYPEQFENFIQANEATDDHEPILEICAKVGIEPARRVNQLTEDEILRIRDIIERDWTVKGDLRREVAMNIKRLMEAILSYSLARSGCP
jgi:hypothetical protein